VRQTAAARLFPRQMFIKYCDVVTGSRQLLAAHGTRRTAADDRYF
jgi:hypothetical protein